MSLVELADLAAAEGYHALCMRASQLGTHTPLDQVAEARRQLRDRDLVVSMVTGDFPIPENSADGPAALRNITPYLDLAQALDVDLLRVAMKTADDIGYARSACDEAAERGVRLAHQCHNSSLFEEVDLSLEVLQQVGRPNFGLIYEPANLELCGQDYGAATIERLAPHIFNVYLQNQRLGAGGQSVMKTWCRGEVPFDQIPVGDEEGGIDFPAIMESLVRIGYDGFATVHQASVGLSGPSEAAAQTSRYLRSIAPIDDR
jgi:sugar phosphate isomerase/epimerase